MGYLKFDKVVGRLMKKNDLELDMAIEMVKNRCPNKLGFMTKAEVETCGQYHCTTCWELALNKK